MIFGGGVGLMIGAGGSGFVMVGVWLVGSGAPGALEFVKSEITDFLSPATVDTMSYGRVDFSVGFGVAAVGRIVFGVDGGADEGSVVAEGADCAGGAGCTGVALVAAIAIMGGFVVTGFGVVNGVAVA